MARSPAKPPANATGRAFLMLYLHNSSVHGRQDRRQTSRQDVVELNRELSRDRIPKISNGKTSTGYKFASDICTQIGTDGTCAGITGDITATFDSATSIPEPAALAILGSALLCLPALRRRQRS